ncbi:MAG: proline dehydrogenase family protein [Tannerellaceae bacterium]|nr:proline dehydrogenase family protein [Tannerellaceae bacterium]
MLDFNNTEIAFSYKSNGDLRNAYWLFSTLKYPWVVKCAKVATQLALTIRFPLGWIIRPTLYKQFVGGETLEKCSHYIHLLQKYNIQSTLDYSAEGEKTPEGIEATFRETLRSVDFAAENESLAYAVFKPSTLTTDDLLAKASEKREELTLEEIVEFRKFKERFMALCQRAYDKGVRILVDAEDYCFQDAIDELTDEAMRTYNKKRAIVFATLQMYRHDRMPYLRKIHEDAINKNYFAGIKFVRGAYMEEERERAKRMGYPDPICKNKQATDDNFDEGVAFVIDHIDRMELFMGTHNETSNYKLAALIDQKGIKRDDPRIYFAQLLGMSDNISFNLAHAGYLVTKYVPYAQIRDVLPYLLRRAEENTSVAGQTGRELRMIETELKRRKNKK